MSDHEDAIRARPPVRQPSGFPGGMEAVRERRMEWAVLDGHLRRRDHRWFRALPDLRESWMGEAVIDLSEMVDWLRGVITGDLEKAKAADGAAWTAEEIPPDSGHPRAAYWVTSESVDDEGTTSRVVAECPWSLADAEHIAIHDPRDTIARCEAELDIIEWVEAQKTPGSTIGDSFIAPLYLLAFGYRHRPGWKEEWRP